MTMPHLAFRVPSPGSSVVFLAILWFIFLTEDSCNIFLFKLAENLILFILRKYGFNRAQRQSFKEYLEALQLQHPNVHFFFPSAGNDDPVLDSNLQLLGQVNAHGLTVRLVSLLTHT